MSFQIVNIAIYGVNGKIRTIELLPNAVNIITGQSKTGKSALLHIVDYCLGRRECNVPAGIIRRNVSWYALKLQSPLEEVIVARRNPDPDKEASEDIYIEKGASIDFPDLESIHKTANLESLNVLLGGMLEIDDFSYEPPPGQTRKPGVADVSKSLFFCLQEQTEVASNKILFHRQGEPFIPQAIKDFLPFFLGVITRDYIQKKENIRTLKRQLELLNTRISENERLRGSDFKQAYALINEAKSVGLIEYSEIPPTSWDAIRRLISSVLDQDFENATNIPDEKLLEDLLESQQEIRSEYRKVEAELQSLNELKRSSSGFDAELKEQKSRLESIGLFHAGEDQHHCPLCASTLKTSIPSVEKIRSSLKSIDRQIESVSNDTPYLDRMISQTEERLDSIRKKIDEIKSSIQSLQETNAYLQQLRDENAKRAMIKGRLSFYLEHMPKADMDVSEDVREADRIKSQIEKLEIDVEDSVLEERLNSTLSVISAHITKLAQELKIEHSESPMRLDLGKLTVVADTEDGPYPMSKMGSAETWVSVHLITHLALHNWFVKKSCPVPQFLFLDQPSQAYFPPDTSAEIVKGVTIAQDVSTATNNSDRDAVIRMGVVA